jgi:hypothetical protein
VIRRPPADQKINVRLWLEVLLGVVRLKSDLPEIGSLAMLGNADEVAPHEIPVKFPVPILQS